MLLQGGRGSSRTAAPGVALALQRNAALGPFLSLLVPYGPGAANLFWVS